MSQIVVFRSSEAISVERLEAGKLIVCKFEVGWDSFSGEGSLARLVTVAGVQGVILVYSDIVTGASLVSGARRPLLGIKGNSVTSVQDSPWVPILDHLPGIIEFQLETATYEYMPPGRSRDFALVVEISPARPVHGAGGQSARGGADANAS
jgi:hypothetical protein